MKLEQVMIRLRQANLKKCFLFWREEEYLGHEVSGEGVRPLGSKIAALKHWAIPVNLDELRSFLGLACYYKHFVPDYSAHEAPLNELTRKEVPFLWGKEQKCLTGSKLLLRVTLALGPYSATDY